MEEHGISQLPVIKDGHIIGGVNEATMVKLLHDRIDLRERSVSEVMGKPFPQIDADTDISEPYRLLMAGHSGVVITDNEVPIGFLSRIDLVEFWQERLDKRRVA
jgi:cystathionine beta-synthase